MRHFSLILLLSVLFAACFNREVKAQDKSKPQLKTVTRTKATKAKPKPKAQTQTAGEKTKSADAKPQDKPKTETTTRQSDSTGAKSEDKSKPATDSKATAPKGESKDAPEARTKAKQTKTTKTAGQSKTAKTESNDKSKQQTAEKSKTPKVETKEKSKQQTAVEPKEKQKTLTPNPPTKTDSVKSKTEADSVKSKTAKAPVKPKPGAVAVKQKPAPKKGVQPCNIEEAPAIRSLWLGMSRRDADRIIPTRGRVNYGNSSTITAYIDAADGFDNIGQVTAQFDEDRLNVLEIDYDKETIRWKNVEEFAESLSENLRLPHNAWNFRYKKWNRAEMKCKGFSLRINSEMNELTLEDSSLSETSEQENDNTRKIFKP